MPARDGQRCYAEAGFKLELGFELGFVEQLELNLLIRLRLFLGLGLELGLTGSIVAICRNGCEARAEGGREGGISTSSVQVIKQAM